MTTTNTTETAQDLVQRFELFVNDNHEVFEPFRVIFEQPERWHSGYADTLLDIFGQWRLFPLAAFRSAYREMHGVENVDVISAVKRAMNSSYRLLTIEERSLRAIKFALEQVPHSERDHHWLALLDGMLRKTLSVTVNDFHDITELRRAGGIEGAAEALGCDVYALIDAMNEGMARD